MKASTVNELIALANFEVIALPDGEKAVNGCYAGDLLSWVMGNASPGNCWVTIMTNINVIAVASLIDLSCVVICENAELEPTFVKTASERGVNILRTSEPLYEACVKISSVV